MYSNGDVEMMKKMLETSTGGLVLELHTKSAPKGTEWFYTIYMPDLQKTYPMKMELVREKEQMFAYQGCLVNYVYHALIGYFTSVYQKDSEVH